MSERTLKRLVGALGAVAAIWLVVFLVSNRGGDTAPEITGPVATFFANADSSNVEAARFIRMQDTVELRNVGGAWLVDGFRSDSGSVSRFFQTLRETEIVDVAATNPSNHGRMGVAADTAPSLEIDQGGATRRILVGLDGPRARTFYVRMPDEDVVYLAESGVRSYVFRGLDDWRNRRMLAIDTARVRRITVERDGESATVVRTDSTWTFANGDAANARTVQSILDQLGGGLVAARFVADTDSIGRLPAGGTTVAYAESGERLAAVTVGSGSGDRWATAAGDSVRYRLPPFRVDLIVPTVESLSP
ncbi:MAG: DUF4340 domain-containing protein [Gemmatimonadales bacterium]